jgi:hypothetical protein
MRVAGYLLTGMRKCRSRAHSPLILAHSLTTEFFGIEEREGYYPDFEFFHVWGATARLCWQLREIDHLAGQSSLEHFGHWFDPARRQIVLCTKDEAKRARYEGRKERASTCSLVYNPTSP